MKYSTSILPIKFCLAVAVAIALSCGNSDTAKHDAKMEAPKTDVTKRLPQKKKETAASRKAGQGATALTKAQIVEYQTLLQDGRRKVRARQYDAGIALYQKGLAVKPGNSTMLVELGYAAFLNGDLDRAETVTKQGLARIGNVKMKGAALYNLGRIAEQQGDKEKAAALYRESLSVRPNRIVKKRLASMGNDAENDGATVDFPELGPLKGPLSSLRKVCNRLVKEKLVDFYDDELTGCALDAADTVEISEGPLKRAILLPLRIGNGDGFRFLE
jgi:tetratricopeptide (TPR) repeat protein